MQPLKPNKCPFCGSDKLKVGTKVTDRRDYKGEDTITASVRCNSCHARGPTVSYIKKTYCGNASENYINGVFRNQAAENEAEKCAIESWNNLKGLNQNKT